MFLWFLLLEGFFVFFCKNFKSSSFHLMKDEKIRCLRALTTDAAGKLDVLGHDGHTLGVDGSKVGVLEKTNKVSLGRLLKSEHGGTLEAEVGLEILSDLTDKSLEGKLADEKLGGLLVTTDLTKSHGTGTVSVGLLDTTSSGGALAGSLGGELLAGGLASGRFACSLLCAGHGFL
jgi:hypothetical protein